MSEPDYSVSLDSTATPEEVGAAQGLFEEVDPDLSVQADFIRKGAGELAWVVYISVPAMTFLTAFANSFGARLGEKSADAIGAAFSGWVGRLYKTRKGNDGAVVIRDSERHLEVVLPREALPQEAYEQLIQVLEAWPDGVPGRANQLNYKSDSGWARPW